jgi:hypothetical protein
VGSAGTILQSGAFAPPVRPGLGPVLLLPSASVQLTVTGLVGQTYGLQFSSNLTDWVVFTNISLSRPSEQLIDASGGGHPRRYYRAFGE